jgi:hypothetical protein
VKSCTDYFRRTPQKINFTILDAVHLEVSDCKVTDDLNFSRSLVKLSESRWQLDCLFLLQIALFINVEVWSDLNSMASMN